MPPTLCSLSVTDSGCYKDHGTLNMAYGKTTNASSEVHPSSKTVDGDRAELDGVFREFAFYYTPQEVI